jgi:hypothetical protein
MHTIELNTQLWNTGVYLSKADLQFAPENFRKEWHEVSKRSALEEAKAKVDELKDGETDFLKAMNEIAAAVLDVSRPKDELLGKMRELVVDWLLRGELVAFDFEKPRRMEAVPHQLSAQLWNG